MEDAAGNIEKAFSGLCSLFPKEKEGKIYHIVLDAMDKSLIINTLKITFGNQIKAAKLLGINRNTLRSKIKKLGINASLYK